MVLFDMFQLAGKYPGSRQSARQIRSAVIFSAKTGYICNLDFEKVESITPGFADELIAILFCYFGPEWIKKHIHLKNTNQEIKYTILEAVEKRTKMTEEIPACESCKHVEITEDQSEEMRTPTARCTKGHEIEEVGVAEWNPVTEECDDYQEE